MLSVSFNKTVFPLVLSLLLCGHAFGADLIARSERPEIMATDGVYEGVDNGGKKCTVKFGVLIRGLLAFDWRDKPIEISVSTKFAATDFAEVAANCSRHPRTDRVSCVGTIGIQGDGMSDTGVSVTLNEGFEVCHPQDLSYCIKGPFVTYYNEERDEEVHCSELKKK